MQRGAGRDDIGPFQRDPHSKNQQLCRGLDMTAEPTTSGVDATRPPLDRAAAITRSLLGDGVLAGVCYLVVGLMQARTARVNLSEAGSVGNHCVVAGSSF